MSHPSIDFNEEFQTFNKTNKRRNQHRNCRYEYKDNRDDVSSESSTSEYDISQEPDVAQRLEIIPADEEYEADPEKKEVARYKQIQWREPIKRGGKYELDIINRRHFDSKVAFNKNKTGPNVKELARIYNRKDLPIYIKGIHEGWSTEEECRKGYLGPIQLFWLFLLKLDVLKCVPKWSNARMKQLFDAERLQSIKRQWKDMDKNVFIMVSVLMLYMGTVETAKLDTFWNERHGVKAIYEVMSKDKFKMWRRSITLYNPDAEAPEGEEHSDKAWKVTYFFNKFKEVAKIFWYLEEKLAVDEQILEMKNRSKLKRLIKTKIHSIGAKLWKIANRKGYNYAYLLDCKLSKRNINSLHNTAEYTVGGSVLLWFIHALHLKNHNIYADRWFNSVPATVKALEYGTTITGTIAKGRKYIDWKELTYVTAKKKVEKDQFKIMINDKYPIITFCGKNKNHFYMISSCAIDWTKTVELEEEKKASEEEEADFEQTNTSSRKRKRSQKHSKKRHKRRKLDKHNQKKVGKNIMNQNYNDYMIGVDVNNALCQTYSSGRRTKKWTLHFYMELLNVVVANSMVLYNNTTATLDNHGAISKVEFIHFLMDELIPVLSSNIIQNTKVKKQQHKKKIGAGDWAQDKSDEIIKSTVSDKDVKYCRKQKANRAKYHKKQRQFFDMC